MREAARAQGRCPRARFSYNMSGFLQKAAWRFWQAKPNNMCYEDDITHSCARARLTAVSSGHRALRPASIEKGLSFILAQSAQD
jgi:hypothetical protein